MLGVLQESIELEGGLGAGSLTLKVLSLALVMQITVADQGCEQALNQGFNLC